MYLGPIFLSYGCGLSDLMVFSYSLIEKDTTIAEKCSLECGAVAKWNLHIVANVKKYNGFRPGLGTAGKLTIRPKETLPRPFTTDDARQSLTSTSTFKPRLE